MPSGSFTTASMRDSSSSTRLAQRGQWISNMAGLLSANLLIEEEALISPQAETSPDIRAAAIAI